MIDRVLQTIKRHQLMEKGDTVVVGVSGGPDSMCLLHLLNRLADNLDIHVYALHVNHMLRGEESLGDEAYVEEFCRSAGIPLKTVSCNVKETAARQGLSVEEAGREIRYRLLEEHARQVEAQRIAVAHNRNDQAETVLLNLIRGTGLDGLKGMDFQRGRIIRPLLEVDRSEIEEYCRLNRIEPRTDRTNLENIYTRNRIRLDLIPYINEAFGGNIVDGICRMASLLREDAGFMDGLTRESFCSLAQKTGNGEVRLNLAGVEQQHTAIRRRVLRMAVQQLLGDLKGIENVHIDLLMSLAFEGKTGSILHLPRGIRAVKLYGQLKLYRQEDMAADPVFIRELEIPGETTVEVPGFSICAEIAGRAEPVENYAKVRYNSPVQFFDYDRMTSGIKVRNRKSGDLFKPYGSTGSKKLKEFFIDMKIPRDQRNKIPVIAADQEIVWVVGYKISDKFKVTENTKRVLKLDYKTIQTPEAGENRH